MGGTISLESSPNQGSVFRFNAIFSLPAEPAIDQARQQLSAVDPKKAPKLPRWAGQHILLVEDIAINRTIAIALLQRVGFTVSIAIDGQQALDLLEKETFDLVLMDIQMPVMDGLTATRAIRANPRWRDLPVIAMTAHAMAEDEQQSSAAGMNAHLTKPISPKILYDELSQWLPPLPADNLPSGTSGEESTSLPEEWPKLPGIDHARGLMLHMNRPELYLKSLHAFRQDFADTDSRIRDAMIAANYLEARRLAHSIKSVAASLGARPLSEVSRKIEQAFAGPLVGSKIEGLLAGLEHEIRIIFDGLGALPPLISPPVSPTITEWRELEPMFELLAASLAAADARSEAQFAKLASVLAGCPTMNDQGATILAEITALIDDVEYESALEKLHQLHQAMKEHQA